MARRKSAGAVAGIVICLLAMAPAGAGEMDKHARMVCSLTANELIGHVRDARGSGVTQENAKTGIDVLAPEETLEAVLKRVQRVTGAIVDTLYALPMEALECKRTKQQAVSICLAGWPRRPMPDGETGEQ